MPKRAAEAKSRGAGPGTSAPEMGMIKLEDSPAVAKGPRLLELLYAAGLRVSELTGLNLADMEQKERMLRVRGKGNKERIVPYGEKAAEALKSYWPVREKLLYENVKPSRHETRPEAMFLNYTRKAADAAQRGKNREEICRGW